MNELKPDILSTLPLELLLYIIGFVPFESARLIPFVSTRYRSVWNQALLVAHSHNGSIEDIFHAVSNFIDNFDEHDPSKNTRKLELHVDKSTFVSTILAPNNVMHMSFFFPDGSKKEESFCWRLEINDQIPRPVDDSSGFVVKTLCLDSVNSLTHEVVSSMVLDFSLLENLKIGGCKGLTSLTIDSPTKLLHLSISGCPKLRYLEIRAVKLKTLHYQGFLPLMKIHEHFNLTNAIFDVRQGPSLNNNALDTGPLLLIIKNSQSLTLCRWMFEELMKPSISSSWRSFQFYKLQELRWIDNSMNQENIKILISFLKLCPSIERLFVTVDLNTYSSKEVYVDAEYGSEHARVLTNLKLVKLEGSKNEDDSNDQLILALQQMVNINQPLLVLSSFSRD
ncbi:PREDICTED: F-box protein At2g39490-like [Camelina sativa]|uniref:F-box protein At2g39490-like n=1 Tax=Camelina sativa TaxID=90675 RepID=A0ABM0Z187_CAMSA|nr:PREDICTED: F-box protein At2g39490-like [Camelina sativa]